MTTLGNKVWQANRYEQLWAQSRQNLTSEKLVRALGITTFGTLVVHRFLASDIPGEQRDARTGLTDLKEAALHGSGLVWAYAQSANLQGAEPFGTRRAIFTSNAATQLFVLPLLGEHPINLGKGDPSRNLTVAIHDLAVATLPPVELDAARKSREIADHLDDLTANLTNLMVSEYYLQFLQRMVRETDTSTSVRSQLQPFVAEIRTIGQQQGETFSRLAQDMYDAVGDVASRYGVGRLRRSRSPSDSQSVIDEVGQICHSARQAADIGI